MTTSSPDTLSPGSKEAIAAGCKCPVLDNNYGKGIDWGGEKRYWYSDNCPLHGQSQSDSDGGYTE